MKKICRAHVEMTGSVEGDDNDDDDDDDDVALG